MIRFARSKGKSRRQIREVKKQLREAAEADKEYLREEKRLLMKKEDQLREEKRQIREEKRQLREKELLILKSKVPPGIAPDEARTTVEKLLALSAKGHLLSEHLRRARGLGSLERLCSFRANDTLPLGRSKDLICRTDVGKYFSIKGREEAFCTLLRYSSNVFHMVASHQDPVSLSDDDVREPHFSAMIAYPGAGKTTVGTNFPWLFRRFWEEGKGEKCLQEVLSEDYIAEYKDMVSNSWEWNMFTYHNLADQRRGALYPLEQRFQEIQQYETILSLRCLHAVVTDFITDPSSSLLYEELLDLVADFAHLIKFEDVLTFIKKGLKVGDKRLLISFFFDEIIAPGLTGPGGITWFQQALSTYVDKLVPVARATGVVPLVCVATTRHQGASLHLTSSRRTPHIPVPVPPLSQVTSIEVIEDFVRRLSATVGRPYPGLNDFLQLSIKLTGGMPRSMGYMLRGMVTSDSLVPISAFALYGAFKDFDYPRLESTLYNTLSFINWPNKYKFDGSGFKLVLQPLYFSLIGNTVVRSDPVVEGIDTLWGELENEGLICLHPLEEQQLIIDPGVCRSRVQFPPMLTLRLKAMHLDDFNKYFPLESKGFRNREYNHLKFICFMLLLLRLLERPAVTLRDIIPRAWDLHHELISINIQVPNDLDIWSISHQICVDDLVGLKEQGILGLLGPSNGLDSAIMLGSYVIVIQSGTIDEAQKHSKASAETIFWSCYQDLWDICDLSQVSTTDFAQPADLKIDVSHVLSQVSVCSSPRTYNLRPRKTLKQSHESYAGMDTKETTRHRFQLDEIIYIYFTHQLVSKEQRQLICSHNNALCKRIIISDRNDLGTFDVLDSMQHLWRLIPLCT